MPEITIVYWRDIPAQVIAGKGRNASRRQLSGRFEQAIDMAAMRAGTASTNSYLSEWRKAKPYSLEGEPAFLSEKEALRLEKEYDTARIMSLIENHGRTKV